MRGKRTHRVKIRDKFYQIIFTSIGLPEDADANINYKTREIRVRPKLSKKRTRECIVHEFKHARWPELHELEVKYSSENLIEVLNKVGL